MRTDVRRGVAMRKGARMAAVVNMLCNGISIDGWVKKLATMREVFHLFVWSSSEERIPRVSLESHMNASYGLTNPVAAHLEMT